MGSQDLVMQCYERIAVLTASMLQFARAGNWEAMAMEEVAFCACVERLKETEPAQVLNAAQVEQKYQLLCKIIADDAEIRDLVMPELARLGKLMGSMQRQQSLHQAYGR